jgi:transposase
VAEAIERWLEDRRQASDDRPEVRAVSYTVRAVFRRGRRYGTILCDLERHRPVDLLRERSWEGVANWLRAHPGVEIISRDRGDYYIKGSTAGAPDAIQVADRWHLLKNLREALVRVVDRYRHQRPKSEEPARRRLAGSRRPARYLATVSRCTSRSLAIWRLE